MINKKIIIILLLFFFISNYSNAISNYKFLKLGIPKKNTKIYDNISNHAYDTLKYKEIKKIIIIGNKKTKNKIILNELTFSKGDSILKNNILEEFEKSKQNLLKTKLFNFVTIDYSIINKNAIVINIKVEERWYLWPEVGLSFADRNFNTWLKHRDLSRIIYGIAIEKYNFRGLQQKIRFKVVFGYETEFAFFYDNIFLDNKKKHLLDLDFKLMRNKNIAYNTEQNKLQFHKTDTTFAFKKTTATITYKYRQTLNLRHEFTIKKHYLSIADSVLVLNNSFFNNGLSKIDFFDIRYNLVLNKKDANNYPLKGYYLNIYIQKQGLSKKINKINLFSFTIKFNKYYQLSNRFFLATGYTIFKSLNSYKPYYFRQALGYNDFIRGYEYYVIDGYDFFLSKNAFKYQLLRKFIINMNFIPLKQFKKTYISLYLNLNFDFGYVHTPYYSSFNQNNLENQLLYGYGIGLDFETYYDYVYRIEYTINKLKEHGFFFHISAPI